MSEPGTYAQAPKSPGHGKACNGCGICCAQEPCQLAVGFKLVSEPGGPCPALEFDGARFLCGLARTPSKYIDTDPWSDGVIGPMFEGVLGFGRGCDADLDAGMHITDLPESADLHVTSELPRSG